MRFFFLKRKFLNYTNLSFVFLLNVFGFTYLCCSFYRSKKQGGQSHAHPAVGLPGQEETSSNLLIDNTERQPEEDFAVNLFYGEILTVTALSTSQLC